MTIQDFQHWLQQNPQYWAAVNDPLHRRIGDQELASFELLLIYAGFLEQVGPVALFDSTLILIGREEIASVLSFMRSLNQPDQRINFDHLIPFCDRTANQWYFCFNGEAIVEFDPLDPFSTETIVADSFEDFLNQLVARKKP